MAFSEARMSKPYYDVNKIRQRLQEQGLLTTSRYLVTHYDQELQPGETPEVYCAFSSLVVAKCPNTEHAELIAKLLNKHESERSK